jgi:hypothetical protein
VTQGIDASLPVPAANACRDSREAAARTRLSLAHTAKGMGLGRLARPLCLSPTGGPSQRGGDPLETPPMRISVQSSQG